MFVICTKVWCTIECNKKVTNFFKRFILSGYKQAQNYWQEAG